MPSNEEYVVNVERHLAEIKSESKLESELARENPIILAGSNRTLDMLPQPTTKQQLWERAHKQHYQYFLTTGRDQFGPILVWGCVDCQIAEPDAVNNTGEWAPTPMRLAAS